MTDQDPPTNGRRRRPRRRLVLVAGLVVVAVVLVWGFVAVSTLLEGRDRAEAGRDALDALAGLDPLEADLEAVQADLREASVELGDARRTLHRGVLAPLRPLPVIGRQLASARALATSADEVVTAVIPVVDRVVEGRAAGSDPTLRLGLLADLDERLSSAQQVLDDVDLGPDEALIGPLADARNDAAEELDELSRDVGDALVAVRGMRSFLDGSTYVILAANPAEMANTGGMYLSVGELRTSGGQFDLEEFEHAMDLFPVQAGPETDPDVVARWGHIVPGNDFRKLNLSPRFAQYSGPRALDLWEAASGGRPDGAVVVDPAVIRALLRVVGPVEYEGTSYDADSIVDYSTVGQYQSFGELREQRERREAVAGIARAAVEAMGERSWDPLDLIRALRPTAEGRHLLAYSEDPVQQELWSLVGVDGDLAGDEVLVNLAAVGGHKIDPFLSLAVDATVIPDGTQWRLRLDVTVENATPAGISEFAAGPDAAQGEAEPGAYLGRLAVFAPASATEVRLSPDLPFESYGRDGPLLVAASRVEVGRGDTERFSFEITLADGLDQLTVLPSARVRPVRWTWAGDSWQDVEARTVPLQ